MSIRFFATVSMAIGLMAAPAFAQDQPQPQPVKPPAAKTAPKLAPAAPAPAQQPAGQPTPQAAAGPTTPAISGPQPDWVKLCSNDPQTKLDVCQTSRDLRAETGQTLISVALREQKDPKGNTKRLLIMAIPPGMQIQPGVRGVVDQQAPVMAKYSVCFPNVCLAEVEAGDALIGSMKKGTTLLVQALNVQGRGIAFPIALSGFATAFDGPPLDPKAYQDEQKKLSDQLKKRAEEAAQKLGQTPAQ
jgi:invasion protein IalB